jgi:hypothetical protein
MSKKKPAASKEKRLLSNKQLTLVSIILASIIVIGAVLSFMLLQTPNKFSLNAIIIDQLGDNSSNPEFVANVTDILSATGFKVTYYESKDVNVPFFSELAKGNYGIIILRAHSALRIDGSAVDFFTSEEFAWNKYSQMVDDGLLTRGNYSWETNKYYFAITPKFIENLEGRFPRSLVIAMGCWSLKQGYEGMADAFMKRGATAYIGWSDEVDIGHSDNETIKLLRQLLEENKTIARAVDFTAPDLVFGSVLGYYPKTDAVSSLKISDLIAEAKVSSNLQDAAMSLKPALACLVSLVLISLKMRRSLRFGLSATSNVVRRSHKAGCEESHRSS